MSSGRARVPGRGRSQAGVSLVEMVITVAILGMIAISIVTAMGATVRHSSYTAQRAGVEAEARRLVEWVRSSPDAVMADCGGTLPAWWDWAVQLNAQISPGYRFTLKNLYHFNNGWLDITGGCAGDISHAQRLVIEVRPAVGTQPAVTVSVVAREPNA